MGGGALVQSEDAMVWVCSAFGKGGGLLWRKETSIKGEELMNY